MSQTFYRWKRRYDPQELASLEDRSHRPARRSRATWTGGQAEQVQRLRERYPSWGKDELAVLLRRQGRPVSVSMVGRILGSLGQRGVLSAPVLLRVKRRRGTAGRPWALRKPREFAVERPGNLVELDTLDLRSSPGVVLKQFTARDVVSCRDVMEVLCRATSTAARLFLDTLERRLPFPVRALQGMAVASSLRSSNKLASSAACASSSCRCARLSSIAGWSRRIVLIRRNL